MGYYPNRPFHLNELSRWDSTIPRFLFRGFNEYSGGDQELNTPTAITPHAFLGNVMDIKKDKSVRFGLRHKLTTSLIEMPLEQFRSEINQHLSGDKHVVSHFSSWTADFQTATNYAWRGHRPRHRHIGIFDTSRRHGGNMIMHVLALRAERHTHFQYDHEYLVYGPVKYDSYTCLTLSRWQSTPSPLYPPLYTDWSRWPILRRFDALSGVRWAYNRVSHRLFYHAAGIGHEARWGSCTDKALFLTLIAAEWSLGNWRVFNNQLLIRHDSTETEKRWQKMVSDLSQVVEWAARDATLMLPLVNPSTHQNPEDLPHLSLMIKLLRHLESEIIKIRSRPPPVPEPWSMSLARFFWIGVEAITKMRVPTFWPRARRNNAKRK